MSCRMNFITRFQGTQDDQWSICNVELCCKAPCENRGKAVDRQKVDDE